MRRHLAIAFGVPRLVAVHAMFSRALVVEAVYQASQLSGGAVLGRVVNTGTLRQGPAGMQYSPEPTDKLVVHLGTQVHEFVVRDAQGNRSAATADEWLLSAHRLRYRHRVEGQGDVELSVAFDGSRFEASVKGTSSQAGEPLQIDLRSVGQSVGERDLTGQDLTTRAELSGTIRGKGVEVDVHETHRSRLVSATSTRLLWSQRGSASRLTATSGSTVRAGGSSFTFRGVEVVTDVANKGGTDSSGVVQASGHVERGGEPFGTVALVHGRVVLKTATGAIPLDLGGT
ncbi:MAG: hypothetical protein H6837_04460 [Planctomycetes bacterium]|nr:hypothetical protein [Planctomycetota bacterium]